MFVIVHESDELSKDVNLLGPRIGNYFGGIKLMFKCTRKTAFKCKFYPCIYTKNTADIKHLFIQYVAFVNFLVNKNNQFLAI